MKKLRYIILLILPFMLLSGCRKYQEDLFDDPSSRRVQQLIDSAFETLTSSEEGWYFNYYQGWSNDMQIGGFWFWCKFTKDNMVEAASELDIINFNEFASSIDDEDYIYAEYPAGKTATSGFEIIRGRGAELVFNTHNPILHNFVEPSSGKYQGLEGDLSFVICEVTHDYVKVRGARSAKYMYFYRKTDGLNVSNVMSGLKNTGKAIDRSSSFKAEVLGAYTDDTHSITATRKIMEIASAGGFDVIREINLTYNEDLGGFTLDENGNDVRNIVTRNVKMLYTPNRDGYGITLYQPVTVMGQQITGFTYDTATETFVSNDPEQSVVIKQIPPTGSLQDILGTYRADVYSAFNGTNVINNVTITQEKENLIKISKLCTNDQSAFFFATFYPDFNALVARHGYRIEGYKFQGYDTFLVNETNRDPISFVIKSPGNLEADAAFGYYITAEGAYVDIINSAKLTRIR